MSERTYQGSCHCGAVKYEVTLDLTKEAITCNCSICSRTGSMLSFVPEGAFKLLSGEDMLQDYRFATKTIAHLFCKVCGVRSFGRGTGPHGPMYAINVRCLEGVDLDKVPTKFFDGKSR